MNDCAIKMEDNKIEKDAACFALNFFQIVKLPSKCHTCYLQFFFSVV